MIDLIKAYARAYKDSAATGNRELPNTLLREIEKLLEEKAGAQAEIRRLAAANAELLEALKIARDRLAWFVESYPHDIALTKSEFFAPFDAAIAKHQGAKS